MALDFTKLKQAKPTNNKKEQIMEEEVEHSSVAQAILERRKSSTGPTLADLQLASVIYANNKKENK